MDNNKKVKRKKSWWIFLNGTLREKSENIAMVIIINDC